MPFSPIKNQRSYKNAWLFLLTFFVVATGPLRSVAGVLYQRQAESPDFKSSIYIDFFHKKAGLEPINESGGQIAVVDLGNGSIQAQLQFSPAHGKSKQTISAVAPVSFTNDQILVVAAAGTGLMFIDNSERLTLVYVEGADRRFRLASHEFKLPPQLIGEIQKNQVASLAKYNDRLLIALNGTGWLSAGKLYSIDLRTGQAVGSELFYEKLLEVDLVAKDKTALVITDKVAAGLYDSILGRSGRLFYIRGVDLKKYGSDWADSTGSIYERYIYSAKRSEILQKLGSRQEGGQP